MLLTNKKIFYIFCFMNILVTNNTFGHIGGSETYAYTFIEELKKRNFNVDAMPGMTINGKIGEMVRGLGVDINPQPKHNNYDAVLGSHTSTMIKVKHLSCPIVQTCHGVYVEPEQPSPYANIYVSISDEVKNHLKNKGYESTIIYNGVNLDRFKPTKKINKELKVVLSLSQSQSLNNTLKRVCDSLGLQFKYRNKYSNPIFNIENEINEADLVVTLGRGAYESMACGRPVLVLDQRPYVSKSPIGDGMVTIDNINELMKYNCSGRLTNTVYSDQMIINEFKKYDHTIGEFLRVFAERELDIKKQVDKYLNLIL